MSVQPSLSPAICREVCMIVIRIIIIIEFLFYANFNFVLNNWINKILKINNFYWNAQFLMKVENTEIIIINYFFIHCIEYQRSNGGVSGKNEGAGGTGQGDSHATGEFSLISYSRLFYILVHLARHIICTQASSSVLVKNGKKNIRYSHYFIAILLFLLWRYIVARLMKYKTNLIYIMEFICFHIFLKKCKDLYISLYL